MNWVQGKDLPGPQILDVRTRHCNKRLNLKDEIVTGKVADGGFPFRWRRTFL